jgi:hypothetical protein
MSNMEIEARLTQLESEVAHLKQKLPKEDDQKPWWEEILGSFADDPIYDEAMALGQEYRRSLHADTQSPIAG